MRVAFLGWGSLVWCPADLAVTGSWMTDGPWLPIEFARVSEDGRLTLVMHPDASSVQTLWIRAVDGSDLDQAVKGLKEREKTATGRIGFVSILDGSSCCNAVPSALSRIRSWAEEKGLDAIVWTDLRSNFKCKTKMEFNEENVTKYLSDLKGGDLRKAREYVEKAPKQIETRFRKAIRERLAWDDRSTNHRSIETNEP